MRDEKYMSHPTKTRTLVLHRIMVQKMRVACNANSKYEGLTPLLS